MKNYLFILICILFFACNTAKQMIQDGDLLELQGKHDEAADHYYSALLKQPDNSQAKDGLKISAQQVLDEKFTQFSKFVLESKIEEAVKKYKSSEKYFRNATSVRVKLNWPSEYDEVYLDVRDEYVLGLYDNALRLFKDKKFDAAEQTFQQIAEYDSSFKDATILRLNTVLEPLYQRGLRQMVKGQFRDANISFGRIIEIDDHYKDSEKQRDLAKESATVSVGVFPVLNQTSGNGDEHFLNELISKKIEKSNKNPYVRISNPEEFHKNIEARGWANVIEPQKAAEAGRNFGLRFIVLLQLTVDSEQIIPFRKETKEAYEAFTENILNPITGTYNYISKFRKTNYEDSYESRKLKLKVAYQFIQAADGKVLYNDEIEEEKSDEQHLLTYNGNINNLYPELPNGNYLSPINETWRNQFTQVRRKLLTKEELAKEISVEMAAKISAVIILKLK